LKHVGVFVVVDELAATDGPAAHQGGFFFWRKCRCLDQSFIIFCFPFRCHSLTLPSYQADARESDLRAASAAFAARRAAEPSGTVVPEPFMLSGASRKGGGGGKEGTSFSDGNQAPLHRQRPRHHHSGQRLTDHGTHGHSNRSASGAPGGGRSSSLPPPSTGHSSSYSAASSLSSGGGRADDESEELTSYDLVGQEARARRSRDGRQVLKKTMQPFFFKSVLLVAGHFFWSVQLTTLFTRPSLVAFLLLSHFLFLLYTTLGDGQCQLQSARRFRASHGHQQRRQGAI